MADTVRTPSYPTTNAGVRHALWEGLDGDDTGLPVKFVGYADKTVHIYSDTYGSSTVTVEGSNDPRADPDNADHANAKWVTLADAQGNAISKTADAIEQILENVLWIRPKTASGTGASVTVSIVGRKTT